MKNNKESKLEIEELRSRIIKYRLYDKKNGAVIYYTLDLDKYQLSIQGETVGSYKWTETPSESFLKLMVRCNSGYLLNKLFERVFDLSESIKSVKRLIKEEDVGFLTKEDEKSCLSEISKIYTDCSESFIREVYDILEYYDCKCQIDDYELYGCLETNYKYWDRKAISYFCNNIKPKLRKKIKELEEEDE